MRPPITPKAEARFHWMCACEHGRRVRQAIAHDGRQALRHLGSTASAYLRHLLSFLYL